MAMLYKVNVLQALKEKGYNTNRLRKEKLIAEASIQSLVEHFNPNGSTLQEIMLKLFWKRVEKGQL